jgi:hypothetical protein
MNLEIFGYVCLGIVGVAWLTLLTASALEALPVGGLAVVALLGFATLLLKVVRERSANDEDDYYVRNVRR